MNDLPCTDTLDLFDSAPPEPQQQPQATATAISDLEQQAKAYARKMAALQIRNGFEPTHLHTYTDRARPALVLENPRYNTQRQARMDSSLSP